LHLVGRIALFGLAAIGLIASFAVAGVWLIGRLDPFDPTRVIAVVPNPAGQDAAIVYLHHISDFSADVLAVALVPAPFPAIGSRAARGQDIIAVQHSRISGWYSSGSESSVDTAARDFIAVAWSGGIVDVCPANGAKLVRFDAQPFSYETEHVTLCMKASK